MGAILFNDLQIEINMAGVTDLSKSQTYNIWSDTILEICI